MHVDRTMRWLERRSKFVPTTSFIDPRRYSVEQLSDARAREFIARHHYLATFPAAKHCVGLFGPRSGAHRAPLVGVAIFAIPTTDAVITKHTGMTASQGTTLARFILLDEVPANGETAFLARAFKSLRSEKPGVESVVSYADPLAGHIGHAYCAASAHHRGRTKPRTAYRIGDRHLPDRTLSKIRTDPDRFETATRELAELARTPRHPGESGRDWIARLVAAGTITTSRHPGHFVYVFPLTRQARRTSAALPSEPYPNLTSHPLPGRAAS